MNVQNLISKGDVKGAIQILLDNNHDGGLQLMSRFNSLARQEMMRTIDFSHAQIERNRIVQAVLDYSREKGGRFSSPIETISTVAIVAASDFNEGKLLEIITTNKRRRPEIADKAQRILTAYRDYKDTKQTTPSFDPAGRRLRSIQADADDLLKSLDDEKEASLEKIVERIAQLIELTIPEYSALKEAYNLASGRGFKNNWVEQQLASMPDDTEVRISIAEKIEAFTANIYSY